MRGIVDISSDRLDAGVGWMLGSTANRKQAYVICEALTFDEHPIGMRPDEPLMEEWRRTNRTHSLSVAAPAEPMPPRHGFHGWRNHFHT